MTVNNINHVLQGTSEHMSGSIYVRSDADFISTLTIGQVIKGKVLRHYESGGYLVSFNGQEKVVDSSVPLKSGEIIYGRIIGLGEQVQLKRMNSDSVTRLKEQQNSTPLSKAYLSSQEKMLIELFSKYNMSLSAADMTMIVKLIKEHSTPEPVAFSGLILSKLGLSLTPELIRAITRVLRDDDKALGQEDTEMPSILCGSDSYKVDFHNVVGVLSSFINQNIQKEEKEREFFKNNNGNKDLETSASDNIETNYSGVTSKNVDVWSEWLLGRWILNAQNEGSVAHRVIELPLWIGDDFLEIKIAFFSQHKNTVHINGIHYQRIVFSLDTEALGHIEISLTAASRNLRVNIAAREEASVNFLSGYTEELRTMLVQYGWQADEITYLLAEKDGMDAPMRMIAEHFITQDSLNRLI